MAKDTLPISIDPIKFAEMRTELRGHLPLANMDRLASNLLSRDGDVAVELQFGIEYKTRFIKGHIQTVLNLQCQRCLAPFALPLESDFMYGIITKDEDAKKLSDRFEPLLIQDDTLNLQDMVEDELILDVPIVPMHDETACNVTLPIMASDPDSDATKKNNPFKIIESLRSSPSKCKLC